MIIRKATFAGRDYNFVELSEEDVRATPGHENLRGLADTAEQAAHASWWAFRDEAEVRERHWKFEPGDVVMDVGVAMGSYALTAAAQGAVVHAFEPCPYCLAVFRRNVAANPDFADRIAVHEVGVAGEEGWYDPARHAFVPAASPGRPGWLRVAPLSKLFEMVSERPVAMLKLDVEGAERLAILSGLNVLGALRPRLLIEEHRFVDWSIGPQIERALLGIGYREPVRVNHGDVDHAYYEP